MIEIRRARSLTLCRFAFHDHEGHGDLPGQTRLSGDSTRQNFNGLSAHLIARYPNRRQPRVKLRGEFRVAVSGDRHVLGNSPTASVTFLDAADGEYVARKEYRIDSRIAKFENVQR